MVQETASPETGALPVSAEVQQAIEEPIAADAEAQPEPQAEEGKPEGEESKEESPKPRFDPEAFAEDESYQEHLKEIEQKAHRQGQIREAGQRKQILAQTTAVVQGLGSLNQTLQNAVKNGADPEQIQGIIRDNASILSGAAQVFQEQTMTQLRNQNRATAIAEVLATVANHPSINNPELAKSYYERLVQDVGSRNQAGQVIPFPAEEFEIDGGAAVLEEFFKDVYKFAEKKGYERGVKAGAEGSREESKANSREGKGPAEVKGSAGISGIRSMSDADRRYSLPESHPDHISHEQYSEARKRFGVSV